MNWDQGSQSQGPECLHYRPWVWSPDPHHPLNTAVRFSSPSAARPKQLWWPGWILPGVDPQVPHHCLFSIPPLKGNYYESVLWDPFICFSSMNFLQNILEFIVFSSSTLDIEIQRLVMYFILFPSVQEHYFFVKF